MTRSGTDDDLSRILLDQFLNSNLVVSDDLHGGAFKHKILINVPGEGIIVVDHDQSGRRWNWRGRVRLVG